MKSTPDEIQAADTSGKFSHSPERNDHSEDSTAFNSNQQQHISEPDGADFNSTLGNAVDQEVQHPGAARGGRWCAVAGTCFMAF